MARRGHCCKCLCDKGYFHEFKNDSATVDDFDRINGNVSQTGNGPLSVTSNNSFLLSETACCKKMSSALAYTAGQGVSVRLYVGAVDYFTWYAVEVTRGNLMDRVRILASDSGNVTTLREYRVRPGNRWIICNLHDDYISVMTSTAPQTANIGSVEEISTTGPWEVHVAAPTITTEGTKAGFGSPNGDFTVHRLTHGCITPRKWRQNAGTNQNPILSTGQSHMCLPLMTHRDIHGLSTQSVTSPVNDRDFNELLVQGDLSRWQATSDFDIDTNWPVWDGFGTPGNPPPDLGRTAGTFLIDHDRSLDIRSHVAFGEVVSNQTSLYNKFRIIFNSDRTQANYLAVEFFMNTEYEGEANSAGWISSLEAGFRLIKRTANNDVKSHEFIWYPKARPMDELRAGTTNFGIGMPYFRYAQMAARVNEDLSVNLRIGYVSNSGLPVVGNAQPLNLENFQDINLPIGFAHDNEQLIGGGIHELNPVRSTNHNEVIPPEYIPGNPLMFDFLADTLRFSKLERYWISGAAPNEELSPATNDLQAADTTPTLTELVPEI